MKCEQEFYYVACARTDGTAPGLEKAFHSKIFLVLEDAEEFAAEHGRELKMEEHIRAFKAVAYWPEDYNADDSAGNAYECRMSALI